MQVNIFTAKNDLSKLIRLIETGQEETIVIAKHGRPVVRLTTYNGSDVRDRIGKAGGSLVVNGDFDRHNDEISSLFGAIE